MHSANNQNLPAGQPEQEGDKEAKVANKEESQCCCNVVVHEVTIR